MIPGETIATGASEKCEDCGVLYYPRVCRSWAGYYVGTECPCGPNSRESGYYESLEEAKRALKSGAYSR